MRNEGARGPLEGGPPEGRSGARARARRLALVMLVAAGTAAERPAAPAGEAGAAEGGLVCVVRLAGPAPELPEIVPDKNVEHCGELLRDPVLVVAGDRVSGAVAWIDAPPVPDTGPPREVRLRSEGCLMRPRVQATRVGARLVLANGDAITHNPHGWLDGGPTVFNVTLLDERMSVSRTLRRPGPYRIDCDTHGWMRAWVWAFEHPFFAVTGADGEARLAGLSAGRHELVVWHEVLGERRLAVDVAAGEARRVEVELALADRRRPELVPPGMRPWIPREAGGER